MEEILTLSMMWKILCGILHVVEITMLIFHYAERIIIYPFSNEREFEYSAVKLKTWVAIESFIQLI